LALAVIFLVLGILIGVIKTLVSFLPYKEEKAPQKTRPTPAPDAEAEEHTVAIHAAIAIHSGKLPHQIQITNINSI
jgi:Na+-transporting methylmalonyl-CoA/oxaloacetate decarboxylase gamma subunit